MPGRLGVPLPRLLLVVPSAGQKLLDALVRHPEDLGSVASTDAPLEPRRKPLRPGPRLPEQPQYQPLRAVSAISIAFSTATEFRLAEHQMHTAVGKAITNDPNWARGKALTGTCSGNQAPTSTRSRVLHRRTSPVTGLTRDRVAGCGADSRTRLRPSRGRGPAKTVPTVRIRLSNTR